MQPMLEGCGDGNNPGWQEAHAGPIISVGFRQLTLFHLVRAIKAMYFSTTILPFVFYQNLYFSYHQDAFQSPAPGAESF